MSIFPGKSKRYSLCEVYGTAGTGVTEADAARELAYHRAIALH